MTPIAKRVGKFLSFIIGSVLLLAVHAFFAFGTELIKSNVNILYALAVVIGLGHSITLIQSLVG